MSNTVKKAVFAALVVFLAAAIFFACVGANGVARWSFAFFILTGAAVLIDAIFRCIDDGEDDECS